MNSTRSDILDWSDHGRIRDGRLRDALALAGVLPDAHDWHRFLDRLLLFMGTTMLATAGVFFFAFNWHEVGRYTRFALVEAPVFAALILAWRIGIEGLAGKAALLFASLVTGALLALVGQTYQTGADTAELFAAWAGAILPWVLVARFPALWILWLALVNTAIALHFSAVGILWGMVFAPRRLIWLLFGLNTAAAVVWEACAATAMPWLRERWAVRVIATASGALAAALAIVDILHWRDASGWGLPLWLGWMLAAYAAYRLWTKDLYVLTLGVLGAIVVATTLLARHVPMADGGEFLFVGMAVIGMSAAGGVWLRRLTRQEWK